MISIPSAMHVDAFARFAKESARGKEQSDDVHIRRNRLPAIFAGRDSSWPCKRTMSPIDKGLEGCNQIVCYYGSNDPESGLSKTTICDIKTVKTHVLLENVHHTIPYLQFLKPFLDLFH